MPSGNQPYIYAPPSHYSAINPYNGFDPKAVSRASLMPPAPRPTPRQEGPLLNFNRHPDSYVVGTLPYGQIDAQPMHPATKKTVKTVRWVQLGLRVLEMIGALGMLVCVICIKNVEDSESYIIRVPAAVDILATAYAIYHLARSAKSRTPASSASYHFFALVIDAGLIPFYIFTGLLAKSELEKAPHDKLRWTSFFNIKGTDKVLLSTWLDSLTVASLHLVCCIISLFLLVVFRKIANRPPDMNPLEDNLTSRRKSKHKHKNSELSNLSISAPLTDSTVSFSKSGRSSPAKHGTTTEVRPISFFHTRSNSDYGYSPHNPVTAQFSRSNASIPKVPSVYSQPRSEQMSQVNLSRDEMETLDAIHDRTETLKSDKTMMTSSSVYSTDSTSHAAPNHTPPLPRRSSKRFSMLSDNWFVHKRNAQGHDENADPAISVIEEDMGDAPVYSAAQSSNAFNFGPVKNANGRPYQAVRQNSDYDDDPRQRPALPPKDEGFLVAPLGMHPPTPPPGSARNTPRGAAGRSVDRTPKPLYATSGNTNAVDPRARDSPSPSPSKSRYYGDLGSAMAGIRASPGPSPRNSPARPKSKHDSAVGGISTDWRNGAGASDGPYAGIKKQDFAEGAQRSNGGGRVISSTGADITDERNARFYDYGGEGISQRADVRDAGLRGRNVSGKVAEEGRGGGNWVSLWR